MQMHQGKFTEDFSKNAVYRFLDNPKANWQKYTIELSADSLRLYQLCSSLQKPR